MRAQLVLALCGAVCCATQETTTEDALDLTPNATASKHCTRDDGGAGICVKYSQCRSNLTVDIYGTIDDNEVRVGNCAGNYYWCCTLESEQLTQPPPQTECTAAAAAGGEEAVCPWCVTIHRDGGRGGSGARAACGGVLVGDGGAVLTAATCLAHAAKQQLWMHHQGDNYTVHSAITHPDYSSGSRAQDLALLVLNMRSAHRGACLHSAAPPQGDCRAVAWDKQGAIQLTRVDVTAARCGARGGPLGAACARFPPDVCRHTTGAPLLCPAPGGGWAVWGVSRGAGCGLAGASDAGALYSSLSAAAPWLEQRLPGVSRVYDERSTNNQQPPAPAAAL